MACTKCKSVTVISQQWKTTKPSQGTIERELTVHECPGCGGKMTTELKQTKMIHTCSKCGDDSAFCCATKPGAGATKGMEKEQK
jgi:formamidopyrimidine-DNA glycosylase